jgi:quinol monooxygenase YgiN
MAMYARSTTIQARPSSIDDGVAHIRDVVMPALERMDGCVGLSLLVDRESGRCIATSAWQSEEAMRASRETIRSVRDQAAEVFGGSPEVEEWEIAVLHRDHASRPGAGVRGTWFRVDPAQADRAIETYRENILPMLEELDGFCSASLFTDRQSGRAVSSVTFDDADAMNRNRQEAETVRSTGVQRLGADLLDVSEFELAIAHLRVPELA